MTSSSEIYHPSNQRDYSLAQPTLKALLHLIRCFSQQTCSKVRTPTLDLLPQKIAQDPHYQRMALALSAGSCLNPHRVDTYISSTTCSSFDLSFHISHFLVLYLSFFCAKVSGQFASFLFIFA